MTVKLTLLAALAALPTWASLPFTVTTEDATAKFSGAPRIQAFSFAQWKGRWVFIGGRTSGYHAVGGADAEFLRAQANRHVWVVDTTVEPIRTYSAPLDSLPDSLLPVRDQWASTAQLSFQDGQTLYIAGGYGQDHQGNWQTYPLLSQVNLPSLIDGVMKGSIPAGSIHYVQSSLVQATGGELIKLADGHFYLVMGHNFTGSYTAFQGQNQKNRPTVSQEYLDEIRKLKVTQSPTGILNVTLVERYHDEGQFHRRDLNVTRSLSSKGLGLTVYGGVFTPDQLGWTHPIYLHPGAAPVTDAAFEQKMNGYSCATMLLYDSATEAMYTTFFGGISRHDWDAATRKFVPHTKIGTKSDVVYLDGLQWSDQISTIRHAEQTTEFVHPQSLPSFLGSDAVFIPAPDVPRASPDTEILNLKALAGKRTFVGYLYGGIRASPYRFPYTRTAQPYNSGTVPTKASDLVLKVYVEIP